jgi:hypothetical protein
MESEAVLLFFSDLRGEMCVSSEDDFGPMHGHQIDHRKAKKGSDPAAAGLEVANHTLISL